MTATNPIPPDATLTPSPESRVEAVDLLRGLVMLLMVVDHVRVYSGVPPGGPEPAVFFTRWITHFCAPWFAFLAGTSARLAGRHRPSRAASSRWLLSRGLWLVFLEFTVMRLSWTFNLGFDRYLLAGVLWMLGACMALMAALIWLPNGLRLAFGLVVIAAHPLIRLANPDTIAALLAGPWGPLARIVYFGGGISVAGASEPNWIVLYSLVPWIGVMCCGYAFGAVWDWPSARRRRVCLAWGGGAVALFLLLRFTELYGDRPWRAAGELPAFLAFFNASKYPASLHFVLMTLGPGLLLMPWLERMRGRWAERIGVFGRTPLFFYVLHIPLVHLLALGVALVRTPTQVGWLFENHPMRMGPVPEGYRWPLAGVYVVAVVASVILYFPCRALAQRRGAPGAPRWLRWL